MLYKSKINLSVILIIIGIGLVPTGLFIKGYFSDQVSSEVSPFLVDMEGELINKIEDDYLGLGISYVLPGIYNTYINKIQNEYALIYGIPSTVLYLQNTTLEKLPKYINATRATLAIYDTLKDVESLNSTTSAIARDVFFNNYT